jgi:hypothetical protein
MEAPTDYFYAPDGGYYELVDYGVDLALVRKDAPMSAEGDTFAAEIQKFGYTFHDNRLYYFKSMPLETMVAYNLWEFDFNTGVEKQIMDFGKNEISIDVLGSWNFDKISDELIALEGYLIKPQTGEITYSDRSTDTIIEFKS